MADFEPAVTKTIKKEGGDTLTEDPNDPGGLTRFGISKRSHPEVDPRNLTLDQAKQIYKREYWDPLLADSITNQTVAEMIFDTSVNMGIHQAVRLIQIVLGIQVDGIIGPQTIDALNVVDPNEFLAAFALVKVSRYVMLVKQNRKLEKFLFGWLTRALDVEGV